MAPPIALNRTLYVGFQGQEVAVIGDAPEVLAGLARIFSGMLVGEPARPIGRLEVDRDGGRYRVRGNTEIDLEDGSLHDVLRCLRFSVIQLLIQARPDLLWLHAGAAARSEKAILFPGLRGRGKSTLVTRLCARGWAYLSDDIVPIDPASGAAIPFPQTPAIREHPGQEMGDEWLRAPNKVEVPLRQGAVCREPVRVAAVVFPAYSADAATELNPCSPATAAADLLRHCWNFSQHGETAVRLACALVSRVPCSRLSFRDGDDAAEYLDHRATDRPPA
ncbi:MAG: hypothetical protein ACREM3_07615 [Candidatus Rokuibacteriota bacterium]